MCMNDIRSSFLSTCSSTGVFLHFIYHCLQPCLSCTLRPLRCAVMCLSLSLCFCHSSPPQLGRSMRGFHSTATDQLLWIWAPDSTWTQPSSPRLTDLKPSPTLEHRSWDKTTKNRAFYYCLVLSKVLIFPCVTMLKYMKWCNTSFPQYRYRPIPATLRAPLANHSGTLSFRDVFPKYQCTAAHC